MPHPSHDFQDSASSNIRLAFFLNLSFTIVEIVGGVLTNSLAISPTPFTIWVTAFPWD